MGSKDVMIGRCVRMAGLGNVGVYWQLGLGMWVYTDSWAWECGCVLTAGLGNVGMY
jgi:hypothetical protein